MEILYYCKRCDKPVYTYYGSGTYCSQSCANRRKGVKRNLEETKQKVDADGNVVCLNYGKIIKKQNKYCNHKCQMEHQQRQFEEKWLNGNIDGSGDKWNTTNSHVRTYLFKKYSNSCAKCGWNKINPFTNTIPLEVEHIDGDPYNNSPENLTLLCPNCHALTRTYRGANKGHGRKKTWKPG